MQRAICVLFVFAVSTLMAADADDLKAMQGSWKTVGGEAMGKPFPAEGMPDFSFVTVADGKSTGKYAGSEWQFTMTVNSKNNPKTIENSHHSGPQKGMKQYGIYKLEGDKFTVCFTVPGAPETARPKDFSTKGNTNVVYVFERVRKP